MTGEADAPAEEGPVGPVDPAVGDQVHSDQSGVHRHVSRHVAPQFAQNVGLELLPFDFFIAGGEIFLLRPLNLVRR